MNDMMKLVLGLIIGFVVGALVVVAYYSSGGEIMLPPRAEVADKMENVRESISETADKVIADWVVRLDEQSDSGQVGVASLNEENGQVKVVLTMVSAPGASVSAAQPAHIHVGSCPNPAAVKFPLTDIVNGSSETMIPTTIAELKASLPLAINTHKSASQLTVYTSCGDLK